MCSEQNRRFKSKLVQHDCKNKRIANINKAYHANVNVNLMVENVIQIKSGIMINVDVSMIIQKKYCVCKNIKFTVLIHVVVKMVNI